MSTRRTAPRSARPGENAEASYPVSDRNQVRRRHDRGHYDHATVHALLDAGMLCHVAYVMDGQPYCTPTFYWREGTSLYWHGSSASRMLRHLSEGEPCCLTVTHLDSLVLARCGFNHSADYRSVLAFGRARLLEDPEQKAHALKMMVDRCFPDRTADLRPSTTQEVKATSVLWMEIEQASAKIRARGVVDDDEDLPLPIYAERLPIRMVIGDPEPSPALPAGVARPESLSLYARGRVLDEVLVEAHRIAYGDDA